MKAENEVLLWWEEKERQTNEAFLPLYFDESRYLILMGGGGSGKSIFAGEKILERCISEPGHRMLVCRKVAKTLRQSCFNQLCGQAMQNCKDDVEQINKSELCIRFRNGSEILFAGLDDVEKLKSIYNITSEWIEEASEISESDFDQLDIRLRGNTKFYKQIILSFNPISMTHWLKRRFFDRRVKNATISVTTYKNNRFLDREAIEVLESFKETDPYYYQVYCLGQWGVTGKTVFPREKISRQIEKNAAPIAVGYFDFHYDGLKICDIRWVDDKEGYIKIYETARAGRPYVLGGDTAGEGSDYFVGQMIDNVTGKLVATLRHEFDEDTYARQMYCFAKTYNNALIGIETNYSTFPQKELERLGYKKFYTREQIDTFTGKTVQAFGFKTTSLTRPVIIAQLIQIVREHAELIRDQTTLEEMLTFVRNEKGRPEAESGAHDDCVMALAIAYFIRSQQSSEDEEQKLTRAGWTKDMTEDYRRATAEEKQYLIRKWGKNENG